MSEHLRAKAVLLCGLTVSLPVAAQQPAGFADAVLGRWDLTITDGESSWPSWLEVRLRTEGELMGRFVGRFGSVRHLPEIAYENGELRFAAPIQYESGDLPLRFAGSIDDDVLRGTLHDSHGAQAQWAGVRAPVLPHSMRTGTGEAIELFNGKDLNGWEARDERYPGCWQVIDGELTNVPPCVDLISSRRFEDFRLYTEFTIPANSNSGIYLRGRHEVQIQDTAGQALDSLRMGAIYGFITPIVDAAGPPDAWQRLDVRLIGREVTVILNGVTVIDAERIPGITGGALDSNEGARGPIMLQGDHGAIRFRRIELTPLIDNQ